MSEDNDDWSEKTDMTRIEDLSDFFHEEDPEVNEKLEELEGREKKDKALDISELEEDSDFEESTSSFGNESDDQEQDEEEEQEDDDDTDFLTQDSDDNSEDEEEGDSFGETDEEDSFGSTDSFEEVTQPNFEIPPEFSNDTDEDDAESDEEFSSSELDSDYNFSDDTENEEINKEIKEEFKEDNDDEETDTFDSSEFGDFIEKDEQDDEDLIAIETPLHIPPAPVVSTDKINTTHKTQENFQELRDYGNAISYGNVTTGGNPPFSIILRNIVYKEDAEDIFSILKEFGVVTAETELTTKQGLESGSLLISQISEYSAIFLAHKFRRFNLEIRIGLSEQLHHSRSYEGHGKGLVTKDNIHQNINEEVLIKHKVTDVKDIILVTTANLNDFDIHRYIEVITSHTLISHEQLEEIDEEEISYHTSINDIYQDLATQLKSQAFKIGANAVTGINYSLTPLPKDKESSKQLYKVTCFGNAVLAIFKSTNS